VLAPDAFAGYHLGSKVHLKIVRRKFQRAGAIGFREVAANLTSSGWHGRPPAPEWQQMMFPRRLPHILAAGTAFHLASALDFRHRNQLTGGASLTKAIAIMLACRRLAGRVCSVT
jgi:hypothetical protein